MATKSDCPVYRTICTEHGGFTHGAEAEELRQGVERIIENTDTSGPCDNLLSDLRALLDRVDARDSLAWIEAKGRRKPHDQRSRRARRKR